MAGKITAGGWALGLLTLLWMANYLTVKAIAFPFAYCWGGPLLKPVFEPWLWVANLAVVVFFAVQCLRINLIGIVSAFCVAILVFGIPDFIDVLFRLGASCG